MIESGLRPGAAVRLRDPLKAMRAFSKDPECKTVVEGTRYKTLTALDIQRHYLALAEAQVDAAYMPPWAEKVCRQWRSILDRIDQGAPESVEKTLDWALKWAVFKNHVHSKGFSWAEMVNDQKAVPEDATPSGSGTIGNDNSPFNDLRKELFEIDMRFSQLGDRGIFNTLDGGGFLDHHIEDVNDMDGATKDSPKGSRAHLRGQCVRRFAGRKPNFACDWDGVYDLIKYQVLDLSDPFECKEKWKPLPPPKRDFFELSTRLRRTLSRALRTNG
jgi:proteasome accessory factor A